VSIDEVEIDDRLIAHPPELHFLRVRVDGILQILKSLRQVLPHLQDKFD
jgi:hypothetical protein